jgi:hypothetical protein
MEETMTTETKVMGFGLCDSSAVQAVSKRRIGSLPYGVAMGCCDIGEAKLKDGRRVLITWGRNITPDEQFWFAHNSIHSCVWIGADDGGCELVLGETFGSSPSEDWLWLGIRLVREEGDNWTRVEATDGDPVYD